jgi:hypothetical protein
MKKIILPLILILSFFNGIAQDATNYILIPGSTATVTTGGHIQISFYYVGSKLVQGTSDASMGVWTINGNASNPAEGTLKIKDPMAATTVEYTAPDKIPPTNPVAVAVQFHPSAGSKSVVFLICNITVVAGYKVKADMELTGPEGIHIVLSGESITKLKPLADGTNMLEPVDAKSDMKITVKSFSLPKGSTLVSPWQYTIPIFLSIGKISNNGSAPAKMVFSQFGPDQMETIMVEGHTTTAHMIHQLFFNAFVNETIQTMKSNLADMSDQKAWAERMQAHRNDPAYFKTAQGKADLQRMQKLRQELGGNISNPDKNADDLSRQIAQKAQSDPNYLGSAEYQQDLGKQQMLSASKKNSGLNTPSANTRLSGELNIEGKFYSGGSEPLEMTKESTSEGALHATIKISVTKG